MYNPSLAFIHSNCRGLTSNSLSKSWKFSDVHELHKSRTIVFHRTDHSRIDASLRHCKEFVLFTSACILLAFILHIRDDLFMTRDIGLYPTTSQSNQYTYFQWWGRSIHSLGRGHLDSRIQEENEGETSDILSYNEIMYHHFHATIPLWRSLHLLVRKEESLLTASCNTIRDSLQLVLHLKALATDYQWDKMRDVLRDPILTYKFQQACSILQSTKDFVNDDGRVVIGFDWGSCAWRHCGAQADTQEALSELYNGLGLLEPFECLFVLDVIGKATIPLRIHDFFSKWIFPNRMNLLERSLRDIITTFPDKDLSSLPLYVPYKAVDESLVG